MEPFVVVAAHDDAAHVPFRVPVKDQEPIEFSLPRLQFLSEPVARQMKEALLALDADVPQVDSEGQPLFEEDGDGNQVPVMGPPRRTVHETTRATAEAMLKCVVSSAIFKQLQKLTVGELDQIVAHWTEVSSKPLGAVNGVTAGES